LVVLNLIKETSMPKLKLLLLVGLAVSVAACSGQAPAQPTVAPTVAAPPTAVKAPSTAPAATLPSAAAAPKLDPAGMCKATGLPKSVPNFPASLPTDQSQGSDKAPVTLYEYSDFQ
jgi:hypothetical protein